MKRENLFLFCNPLPLRFLELLPVLFVVVRFLPTATLDIRLDLNLRSSIQKSFRLTSLFSLLTYSKMSEQFFLFDILQNYNLELFRVGESYNSD